MSKLTDEQEKQVIKAAIASTMTAEEKALGSFLAAMHDCKLDGGKMREAMLKILGITGDGRGEAKPVAWAWGRRDANGEVYDCISDAEHALNEGRYTVPLYTSPPQQEQAAPHPDEFTCPLCFDDPANIKAAPGAVQDGFVMVPMMATKEMCKAAVIFANGNAVYKNVAAGALEVEEQIYGEAYAAMIAAAPKAVVQDGWMPVETAPEGELVVVFWRGDGEGEESERHDFDYLEDGVWQRHDDNHQHYLMVGGPSLGPGPKEKAPYTHWKHLGAPKAQEPGA